MTIYERSASSFHGYSLQDADKASFHLYGRTVTVGEPDKSQKHHLVVRDLLPEHFLMVAISLTYLTLHPVSVHSMMEAFLGYTDQHLNR